MAVYTEVSDDDLKIFLQQYDIGAPLSFKGIAEGVENSNYLLQTERGTFILTLYEKRVRSADLPFFLGLMDHLAARGIACPTPIHGRDGRALRELCGRPAAIIGFLVGMCARRPAVEHCAALGTALAAMHRAGADYALRRANDLSLAGWQTLFAATAARADEVFPGLAKIIEAELRFLSGAWPQGLREGVIHADLFPDNVFFRGNSLSGTIDYYFACNDALAYDLAICLNAWCFEPDNSFNATKARALLRRYQADAALPASDIATLPILARGAAIRFLLTRLYDLLNHREGALVRPKDPAEYLRKLQFHQSVRGTGDYGLP